MNKVEYYKIEKMSYLEYCDYLQDKYGIGDYDYMTPKFTKVNKVSRTSEGLYAHHKMEILVPSLSEPKWAIKFPWEFQAKENIVYCDLLEHLYMHVLIAEETEPKLRYICGFGGVVDYFLPELNDLYSGWESSQKWRRTCHSKIKNDREVYLIILERFMTWWYEMNMKPEKSVFDVRFNTGLLKTSLGKRNGNWNDFRNKEIYRDIDKIVDKIFEYVKMRKDVGGCWV